MWTTEVFETARGPVPALVAGEGEPLVAWHGFPDLPRTFGPLAERLTGQGWKVVAPWQRGYHPDHPPIAPYFDLATLAADGKALLDALSPDAPVPVIGHDWGAALVYGLAAAWPERVTRAVTMALPPPAGLLRILADPEQMRRSFYIWFFQLPGIPEGALTSGPALLDHLWDTWGPRPLRPPHYPEVRRALADPAVVPAALGYYRALFQDAFQDPELSEVRHLAAAGPRVPVLLLGGDADGCIEADVLRAAAPLLPGGRVEIIQGAGHFLHLEEPDRTAALVREWLGA